MNSPQPTIENDAFRVCPGAPARPAKPFAVPLGEPILFELEEDAPASPEPTPIPWTGRETWAPARPVPVSRVNNAPDNVNFQPRRLSFASPQ